MNMGRDSKTLTGLMTLHSCHFLSRCIHEALVLHLHNVLAFELGPLGPLVQTFTLW